MGHKNNVKSQGDPDQEKYAGKEKETNYQYNLNIFLNFCKLKKKSNFTKDMILPHIH